MNKENIFEQVKSKIKSNPAVLLSLFPNSKQKGSEIYFDAPSYNSWSYNVNKHVVKDFRNGSGGDIIDTYSKYNGLNDSYKAATKLAQQLNIEVVQKLQMPNEKIQSIINNIWDSAIPLTGKSATPAELYLLETRGLNVIEPDKLLSLRYHPEVYHSGSGRSHPALICRLLSQDGSLVGIQRVYLELSPEGTWVKLNKRYGESKMCLGVVRGNFVKLEGIGNHNSQRLIEKIVICEGVESGLALRRDMGVRDAEVWCSLSAGNMVNLSETVHACGSKIKEIDIRPDIDLNKVGINAAMTLARRLAAKGYNVKINYPKIVDTPTQMC